MIEFKKNFLYAEQQAVQSRGYYVRNSLLHAIWNKCIVHTVYTNDWVDWSRNNVMFLCQQKLEDISQYSIDCSKAERLTVVEPCVYYKF